MAYYDLNERLIVAMLQRLQTGLNPIIDAINANTVANPGRNQTAIDYPRVILDTPPTVKQLTNFPAVGIADGNMGFEDDVGWGATGSYEVSVVAYLSHPDPEVLAWQLRRYAQAITTVAMQGRNIDGGAWGTILKRIIPGTRLSKTDPRGQTVYMCWVAVVLQAKDEQNVP